MHPSYSRVWLIISAKLLAGLNLCQCHAIVRLSMAKLPT